MCVCVCVSVDGGGGVSSQHDLLSREKIAIAKKQEIQVGRLPRGLRSILPCLVPHIQGGIKAACVSGHPCFLF